MRHSLLVFVVTALLSCVSVAALRIQIDYSYDTGNFFHSSERRAAMEAVARFFEEMIADELLEIDASQFSSSSWTASFTHPSTGNQVSIPNLVVPENTLIVYVGARTLPLQVSAQAGPGAFSVSGTQAWLDRVVGRGNAGALAQPPTDFAPWGGSMTFNSAASWNFSLTQNQSGREFVTIAKHEMMHVLGFGTSPSWNALRSGGRFHGAAAVQSFGEPPPADTGHLVNVASSLYGSFGTTHGLARPALMNAVLMDTGTNFDVATDLDLAVLEDIGWEIRPRMAMAVEALSPMAVEFRWQAVTFLDYRVERSVNLVDFPSASGTFAGTAGVLQWADPAPPAERAFYRLVMEANAPQAEAMAAMAMTEGDGGDGEILTLSVSYPFIEDCGCGGH